MAEDGKDCIIWIWIFRNLKILGIGAGLGTYSALCAKNGAEVTVLDYSNESLLKSREFFNRNGLKATFISCDALNLDSEFFGKYDISMSFGLTEHFNGEDRFKINKVHADVLRKGRILFISVPNKHNIPYRLNKYYMEKRGRWSVGDEYPYSRTELKKVGKKIGMTYIRIFGDSFYNHSGFWILLIRWG
jgi:2-polyprenyl-3-methyl-5-hydroxy-6-metoxy-1,4-benzoquinol methylase